jgi:peptidoglycan/LPS O-acetylase OafA/YrhL
MIRVCSMGWVILGHTLSFGLLIRPLTNYNGLYDTFENPATALAYGGFYAVDSFFWIAGLLSSSLMLPQLVAKNGKLPWGMLYFHRFWRIVPAVAFSMFFVVTLMPYMANGPLWWNIERSERLDDCYDNWWTVLLFINNFIPNGEGNHCFGHTWYLANDMQFFLITPLMLFLYYKRSRIFGWIACVFLVIMSFVIATTLSAVNEYTIIDPEAFGGKFAYIYVKPYCRICSYAIGILCGFVYYTYNNHKESGRMFDTIAMRVAYVFRHKLAKYVMFVIGLGLINFCMFIQTSFYASVRN